MKTTNMEKTELKDVYCVPNTGDDWLLFPFKRYIQNREVCYSINSDKCQTTRRGYNEEVGKTEIPVSKFIDLLEDKMVGWRLEEIGGKYMAITDLTVIELADGKIEIIISDDGKIMLSVLGVHVYLNIKTFTELETLIRFLKQ